jgi:hypothetical protein
VFRAWTDPDEVTAWYGPEGFDTPREKIHIDLRVGGRYELTMVRPGGAEFPIGYEILELVEPEAEPKAAAAVEAAPRGPARDRVDELYATLKARMNHLGLD